MGLSCRENSSRIVKCIAGYDQISFVTLWINIQRPLAESYAKSHSDSDSFHFRVDGCFNFTSGEFSDWFGSQFS